MTSFTLSLKHSRAANLTGWIYSAVSRSCQRASFCPLSSSSLEIESVRSTTIGSTDLFLPEVLVSPVRSGHIAATSKGPDFSHFSNVTLRYMRLFSPFPSFFLYISLIVSHPHTRESRRRTRRSKREPRGCHMLTPRINFQPFYPLARVYTIRARALAPRTKRQLNGRRTVTFV